MSGDLGTTLSEEKCLIGFDQKSIQFVCCRSVIALKTRIRCGPRNGDTKLSLGRLKRRLKRNRDGKVAYLKSREVNPLLS